MRSARVVSREGGTLRVGPCSPSYSPTYIGVRVSDQRCADDTTLCGAVSPPMTNGPRAKLA